MMKQLVIYIQKWYICFCIGLFVFLVYADICCYYSRKTHCCSLEDSRLRIHSMLSTIKRIGKVFFRPAVWQFHDQQLAPKIDAAFLGFAAWWLERMKRALGDPMPSIIGPTQIAAFSAPSSIFSLIKTALKSTQVLLKKVIIWEIKCTPVCQFCYDFFTCFHHGMLFNFEYYVIYSILSIMLSTFIFWRAVGSSYLNNVLYA